MKIVHTPVLKAQVVTHLAPANEKGLLIDATLGEGGHAELFLESFPEIRILGIDADASILEQAKRRLNRFGDRVLFFNSWFNLFFKDYPEEFGRPDSILFDLGISLFHFDTAERGFSFNKNGPLDMRLEQTLEISAADIVNHYPEDELANLLYEYGEERYSRRIAKAIVTERDRASITSTDDLKRIVWKAVPDSYRHRRLHPATKTFQALRIAVNGELARLQSALRYAFRILKPQGRMGVISFHSLEDRMVKQFFKHKSRSCTCPPEWPVCRCGGEPLGRLITKKPLEPTQEEVSANKASRSAKLRVIEKLKEEEV